MSAKSKLRLKDERKIEIALNFDVRKFALAKRAIALAKRAIALAKRAIALFEFAL